MLKFYMTVFLCHGQGTVGQLSGMWTGFVVLVLSVNLVFVRLFCRSVSHEKATVNYMYMHIHTYIMQL